MTLVLDSHGVTMLAGNRARLEELRRRGEWPAIVPSVVLAEALTGDHRRAFHENLLPERSAHVEHGLQRFIDSPGLFRREVPDKVTKSAGVNGAKLFDENPGGRPSYFNLRTKRCRPGAL